MKLSILITHLPERDALLQRLMAVLQPQVDRFTNVEVLIDSTGRHMPTGTKRNNLIARAQGEYITTWKKPCRHWLKILTV
jgi:hypothetical protein